MKEEIEMSTDLERRERRKKQWPKLKARDEGKIV